ncbi:MAG TPA: D-alanine--D-alanine ligase [Gemmatimonadales bacterium]|nr:D-alanine--D-alanine ligase [Gemmatimonadales bacterium]
MRIVVLTGGSSAEREVAIASTAQIVPALRERGHDVTVADTTVGLLDADAETHLLARAVGTTHPGPAELAALIARERDVMLGGLLTTGTLRQADVVFLGLHGGTGEDGTLQHLLEMSGLRYTGSGPLGSGLALDKDIAKRLLLEAEVPTAAWLMAPVTAEDVELDLDWPVVVKPSREGSSVGLTVVQDAAGLPGAILLAGEHDTEVMVEAYVPGRELTVGILGDDALAVGEIIPRHATFDYECKYTPGMSEEVFPAPLPAALAREVQDLALAAHRALKLRGYSRVDFRLTPTGDLYCLEVNTLPGMTSTSLLPQSAAAVGIVFPELCERICELALEE